jgi:hypothetical protein
MSDVAQPVATTETPVTPDTSTAPVTTPQAPATPNAPFNRAAFKQSLMDQAPSSEAAPEPVTPEQPRGPDGRFITPEAATPPAPEPAKPAPVVPQTVRIPVPDGHWARDKGITEIEIADPKLEHVYRGLLKDATRRADAETHLQRALKAEAQLKAVTESRDAIVASPEVLADIQYLRSPEVNRPDLAELLIAGLKAKEVAKVDEYSKANEQELSNRQVEEQLQEWQETTYHAATSRYPQWYTNRPEFQAVLRRATRQYSYELMDVEQATQQPQMPTKEGLFGYLDKLFLEDPFTKSTHAANKAQQQQADAARIKAAADAAALADAQARHSTLAPVPPTVTTGQITPRPDELKGLTGDKKRKALRDGFLAGLR